MALQPEQVLEVPELAIAFHTWEEAGRKILRLRIYPSNYSWRQRLLCIWNICRARRGLAAEITFGEQDLYLFQRLWHELDPCPPIRYRLPSKVQATIRRDAEGQAHMHLWIDQPLDLGKRFALIKQVFQGIFPPLGDILLEEDTFTAIASLLNEGPTPR